MGGAPGGAGVVIKTFGPVLTKLGGPSMLTATSEFTLTFVGKTGQLPLTGKEFFSRDEAGRPIAMSVTVSDAIVRPGTSVQVICRSQYNEGGATIGWMIGSRPAAQWEFNVELD